MRSEVEEFCKEADKLYLMRDLEGFKLLVAQTKLNNLEVLRICSTKYRLWLLTIVLLLY